MSEDTILFGRLPHERLTKTDAIARMSCAELRAYLAVAVHVRQAWSSYPSIEVVAGLMKKSKRTAQRALRKLAANGHITIVCGGGRHRANTYTLNTNPDTQSVTVSSDGEAGKGDIRSTKTLTPGGRNPDIHERNPDTQSVTPIEEEMKRGKRGSPPAGVSSPSRKTETAGERMVRLANEAEKMETVQ
ncbi:MAG: helix-turn-helix domain-containing protein [Planctomycetes bacterium]|nr:helix-turn-helix domain-containing protein [Planctomycetota bacterium]